MPATPRDSTSRGSCAHALRTHLHNRVQQGRVGEPHDVVDTVYSIRRVPCTRERRWSGGKAVAGKLRHCSGVYPIVDAQAINCVRVSSGIETKSGSNNSTRHLRALSIRQNVQHDKRSRNSWHCKKQSELRRQTEGGRAPGRERGEGAGQESKRTVPGCVAKMLRSCGAGGRRIGPAARC